jgi:hypothetical protein
MEQTDLLEKQQARCTATNTCGRFLSKYPGQPPIQARHFWKKTQGAIQADEIAKSVVSDYP